MCGISGFSWDDKKIIKSMISTLSHRGPDDCGYYNDGRISLGHNRLSIIDLSKSGKQPMTNENNSIWITYNGEIYNFKEIKIELEKKGHKFKSNTDTEVIIHAYEEYGQKCLALFNGMFAFAIWDSNKKQLFLARDRLGIKPLYYYWDNKSFIFASEIKAILKHKIKREINNYSLNHYLTYGFTPPGVSILKNIYKLKPGYILILKKDKVYIEKYWDINFSKEIKKSEKYYIKKIRYFLNSSVKKRLIADVPVGSFLSGGIDSSAIVASIKKFKDSLKTFSIGFEYEEFNETHYAKLVSEKFETDHYERYFSAEDVRKLINDLAYYYDEPFADYSMLPTYFVSKIARKHVKVCLGGDGGDELFGGYNWYRYFSILRKQKFIPSFIKSMIIRPSLNFLLDAHMKNRLKDLIVSKKLKDYELYSRIRFFINKTDLTNLNIKDKNVLISYKPYFKYKNYNNNLFYADLKMYLPEQILTKVDRASMAVNLEARVPFLDHKFVEFSSKIPSKYKINWGRKKYIFKKAMLGILPKEIIYRKKRGFGIPLKQYFRKELKDLVSERLSNLKFYSINQKYINNILYKHTKGVRDYSHFIWSMLMLEEWNRKWIQKQ